MIFEGNFIGTCDKIYEIVYKTSKGTINTVQGIVVGITDGVLSYDVETIDQYKKEHTDRFKIDLKKSHLISTRFLDKVKQDSDD